MRRSVLFIFFASVFALVGCNSNPEVVTRLESFDGSQEQLRRLYSEHQSPLVVVGKGIYLPPPGCLCKKAPADSEAAPASESLPPAAEQTPSEQPEQSPPLGEDDRKIGGMAEQRVFGGGTLPIKCVKRWNCTGFEVLVPNGGDVLY